MSETPAPASQTHGSVLYALDFESPDGAAEFIPILVTTAHRGVFAGLVPADTDLTAKTLSLKSARMAIYWGTTRGVMELAETGPTSKSRISAPADIPTLHDVTAVFAVTADA